MAITKIYQEFVLFLLVRTQTAHTNSPEKEVVFEVENDISLKTLPFLVATEIGREGGREEGRVFGSIVILSIFDILHSFHTYENKGISVNFS